MRRNYYSIRYRNGLFPTDVLAGDLQPTQVGISRLFWFRATSPDVVEVGDIRPIASAVAEVGAFFGRCTCGWSLQTLVDGDFRPVYLRSASSDVAASGVGIYLLRYNWAGRGPRSLKLLGTDQQNKNLGAPIS